MKKKCRTLKNFHIPTTHTQEFNIWTKKAEIFFISLLLLFRVFDLFLQRNVNHARIFYCTFFSAKNKEQNWSVVLKPKVDMQRDWIGEKLYNTRHKWNVVTIFIIFEFVMSAVEKSKQMKPQNEHHTK